jgi:hypothetical protein
MPYDVPKKQYRDLLSELETEASTWTPHWRDVNGYCYPRSARFLATDTNQMRREDSKIINSRPRRALRIAASGLMAGLTSPARRWFNLTLPDQDLSQHGTVKAWLEEVAKRMMSVFARAAIYRNFHAAYESDLAYGTAAFLIEADAHTVVRGYDWPIGSYYLSNSERGVVDTAVRKYRMTVRQVVKKFCEKKGNGFDLSNLTMSTRMAWEAGRRNDWIDVVHVIHPNEDYTEGRIGPKGMEYRSCWFEANCSDADGYLRESGFRTFPLIAPRWSLLDGDVYGTSPAMDCLGDIKGLQQLEERKLTLVDKLSNPPLKGPPELQNTRVSLLPGDLTFVQTVTGGQQLEPIHVIPPQAIPATAEEIRRHEERVDQGFYVDMFLMLEQSEGNAPDMTAREVVERHEEKMLQIGPVLERLTGDMLDPTIDRVFDEMMTSGQLPPPPPELQGMIIRPEYISVLAQAQKLMSTGSVERLASFTGNLVAVFPSVKDKLDTDKMIDAYADMLGVPEGIVRSDEETAQVRAAAAQQAQAQQQGEAMMQAAQGAATLSKADMSGDNALTRLLAQNGGPVAPTPGGQP